MVSSSRGRFSARGRRGARGGTLLGVFVGLVLGLGLAAGVAVYLARAGLSTPLVSASPSKEPARGGKAEPAQTAAADKPRFDFYKILPGGEEPKAPSDRRAVERLDRPVEKEKPPITAVAKLPDKDVARDTPKDVGKEVPRDAGKDAAKAGDRFWLQAGAFNGEPDAENLKARLAMAGWEAVIQPVPLPDKSTRYRVRLGPYDNTDELNRVKGELGKGGFDVAVIRNP